MGLSDSILKAVQAHNALATRPYAGDIERSKRDLAQYQAQIGGAEAMTAPQYYQGRADTATNQGGLLGVELQYAPQSHALKNKLLETEINMMPMKYQLERDRLNNSSSRFGTSFQMSRMLSQMSPAQRNTWISQNAEAYSQMVNDTANATLNKNNQPSAPNYNNLTISPDSHQDLINSGIAKPGESGGQITPTAMQRLPTPNSNRSIFKSTPADVEQQRLAAQMAANKSLTTAATQRQIEGAIQVENIMNSPEMQQKIQSASAYAGAFGKGKAALAALSQQNPQAYEDYLSLGNHDMVLLQNRIKTLDQMGSTDSQREELHGLYEKTMNAWTSNPQQFIHQYNELGKAVDRVAKAVNKSASPVFNVERVGGFQPIVQQGQTSQPSSNKEYSPEDLQFTAQKYGISVDQLKKKLGI